jgi:two-component system, LytTR family, response regulator
MKLKCIVVDDSEIQRYAIKQLIEDTKELKLLGEFANALETKHFMKLNTIDLIFLDIEMPLFNGFDLIDGLKNKPQIIFITSKSDYAVKAFDYEAIDFLHKPISKDRFLQSVDKATRLFKMKTETTEDSGNFIIIKTNFKKVKIFTDTIKWVEAFGDYIKLVTEEETFTILTTMKSFEKELPDEFMRVHKSYIVNLKRIVSFSNQTIDLDEKTIPVSRNKKAAILTAIKEA